MSKYRDFYLWRIAASGVSFALFGLGGIILGYLLFPFISIISRSPEVGHRRCRKVVQLSFRAFIGFMKATGVLTWEISGEALLQRPGQLIVANHTSLIDIVFLISMIPNASCIVKPGVFRNVFMRAPVRQAAYVPNDSPEQLLEDCVSALGGGASLVIFPEGTRSLVGAPLRFKRGAAYVRLQNNGPLALARISPVPPHLGKHESWYRVPLTRPHYRLVVSDGGEKGVSEEGDRASVRARALTRDWRIYFENEVAL